MTLKNFAKNFAKLTGKYLCQSRPETLLRKSLPHRYFPVIFYKTFWNAFFISRCLLYCYYLKQQFFEFFFLLTYLMFIYWSFSSLCICFYPIHQVITIIHISDSYLVCTLSLLTEKLPPSFLVRFNELM